MTDTLTGQFALVGRSSAIVAMSTGLVASVGVPAQAAADTGSMAAVSSVDASASAGFITTSLSTGRSTVLIGSGALAKGAPISAPSAAKVTFETEAFKAVPKPLPETAKKQAKAIADSTSSRTATPRKSATAPAGSKSGSSVLAVAARYVGIPYVYGGTTPRGFDCSGFTGYVYRQLGVSLPRTANDQLQATKRISRSQARPGDLVFFVSGGRAYHNGIYAGGNMMYDSPRSGKTLQKRAIWSSDVVFTRVTG